MSFFSRLAARAPRNRIARLANQRIKTRLLVETLESRDMMHANVVMDAEHLAVFGARDPVTQVVSGGLVPDVAVTDRSIASGNWSDPSIWSNGVPKFGENVLIASGN